MLETYKTQLLRNVVVAECDELYDFLQGINLEHTKVEVVKVLLLTLYNWKKYGDMVYVSGSFFKINVQESIKKYVECKTIETYTVMNSRGSYIVTLETNYIEMDEMDYISVKIQLGSRRKSLKCTLEKIFAIDDLFNVDLENIIENIGDEIESARDKKFCASEPISIYKIL